jgi:AcrR family transcriptional regulator
MAGPFKPAEDGAESQRVRLIEAVVETTSELGLGAVTPEAIVSRAGVAPSVFHANFDSKEAAIEAAHEVVFESFIARLLAACEAQPEWPLKVKVGIGVSLDYAAAAPGHLRFLMLDSLTFNREIARHTIDARGRLARLLAEGRRHSERGSELPSLTEQVLIGGLIGTIALQLAAGEEKRLPELAPQLTQFTLLPYLGAEEAARVARRPKPPHEGLSPPWTT